MYNIQVSPDPRQLKIHSEDDVFSKPEETKHEYFYYNSVFFYKESLAQG